MDWKTYYGNTKAALIKMEKEVGLLDKTEDQDRIKELKSRLEVLDCEAARTFESYKNASSAEKKHLKDLFFGLHIVLSNLSRTNPDAAPPIPVRGGFRPGAGRKPEGAAPKKKISVSVSPEAAEALKNLEVVLRAKNPSHAVDYVLIDAWKKMDRMHPDDRPDLSGS